MVKLYCKSIKSKITKTDTSKISPFQRMIDGDNWKNKESTKTDNSQCINKEKCLKNWLFFATFSRFWTLFLE